MLPRFFSRIARLGFRGRLLVGVWLLFGVLVAARIHGSSIQLASQVWAPGQSHLVAQPILDKLGPKAGRYRDLLMAVPRVGRSDEWAVSTLWALAQFQHQPRFPVRNSNIGEGQNMLLVSNLPVWHASTIARPATWGYFLFGQQMGLAWSWWCAPFLCFTGLVLCLGLVYRRDRLLPALGAFWFCASAFAVCWSHWAAPVVAYGALGTFGLYHLLATRKLGVAIGAGLLTGFSAGGYVIYLYVPWMIPAAYVFGALLIALLVRDRVELRLGRPLIVGALAAVALAALIVVPFLVSAGPELRALGASAYPGMRRLSGGEGTIAQTFAGFFNYMTARKPARPPIASEWSGFFLLFPTVVFAALASRRVRRRLDVVSWTLLVVCLVLCVYALAGFPQWLADFTLLSRVPAPRTLLGIGLCSIIVSLALLRRDPDGDAAPAAVPAPEAADAPVPARPPAWRQDPRRFIEPALALLASAAFYAWAFTKVKAHAGVFPRNYVVPVALITAAATLLAFLLLVRWRRAFAVALVAALVGTAGTFNPLSRGFARLERSELYRALHTVIAADRAAGRHSFWLGTGGPSQPIVTTVMSAMGARPLTGVFGHPQLALWRKLDPPGHYEAFYNRYAESHYFMLPPADGRIVFTLPGVANFNLRASPTHPRLRELGVRYALTWGNDGVLRTAPAPVRPIYDASDRRFRLWQLAD